MNHDDANVSLDADADAVALVQSILGNVCASLTATANQSVMAQGRDQITALDIERAVEAWPVNEVQQNMMRDGRRAMVCLSFHPVNALGHNAACRSGELTAVEEDDSDVRTDDSEDEATASDDDDV